MKTLVLATAAAACLVCSSPATAQAPQGASTQTPTTQPKPAPTVSTPTTTTRPTYEFALGYQWTRTGEFCAAFDDSLCEDRKEPTTFPVGFAIDGVRNWGAVGLVGELGWSHSEDTPNDADSESLSTDLLHAGLGVRFTARKGRVWPYGQVLGGVAIAHYDGQRFDDDGLTLSPFEDTRTRAMMQAGGGLTFVTGDGWGLFVEGAYRRMFLDEEDDFQTGRNDIRIFAGFRLILD